MAQSSLRQPGSFGIGLGSGSSAYYYSGGISGKYFLGADTAAQAVIGFGGGIGADWISISPDFLYEMPALATLDPMEIAWNLGVGGTLMLWDNGVGLAARGVVGLEFDLLVIPLDIVLEYRPGVLVVPSLDLDLVSFGGHVRYYFF